jgi:hypothetical protein
MLATARQGALRGASEDKVGTMLPCNVVVQELGPQRAEVAAVDSVPSMMAIDNPDLQAKGARFGPN